MNRVSVLNCARNLEAQRAPKRLNVSIAAQSAASISTWGFSRSASTAHLGWPPRTKPPNRTNRLGVGSAGDKQLPQLSMLSSCYQVQHLYLESSRIRTRIRPGNAESYPVSVRSYLLRRRCYIRGIVPLAVPGDPARPAPHGGPVRNMVSTLLRRS